MIQLLLRGLCGLYCYVCMYFLKCVIQLSKYTMAVVLSTS